MRMNGSSWIVDEARWSYTSGITFRVSRRTRTLARSGQWSSKVEGLCAPNTRNSCGLCAVARRDKRRATELSPASSMLSPASSIRSRRNWLSRKPARIMPQAEIASSPLGKKVFPDFPYTASHAGHPLHFLSRHFNAVGVGCAKAASLLRQR